MRREAEYEEIYCNKLIPNQTTNLVIIPTLPTVCDKQYAIDSQSILKQMTGLASPKELKKYRDYLVQLQQFDNLSFVVNKFEIADLLANKLDSVTLAQLRIPVTRYNTCRNMQVTSQGTISFELCTRTYAAYMLDTLKELAPLTDKKTLEAYKLHMINLKKQADTRIAISNFEIGRNLGTLATLRSPHSRYQGCRDLIIKNPDKTAEKL